MKRPKLIILILFLFLSACDKPAPTFPVPDVTATSSLSLAEVRAIVARAIDIGRQLGEQPFVAITDREGNILAVYNGRATQPVGNSGGGITPENPIVGSIVRARTAAFLSSNQHAFTTLTACYITRSHYPPSQPFTAGGPLYGVTFSQVGGSDIQPNNGTNFVLAPGPRQPGMTGAGGGIPLYKDGALVGGLGIAFCNDDLSICDINNPSTSQCVCAITSERVARATAASMGYEAPIYIRADAVYNDGVQLLYSNESLWPVNLANTLAGLSLALTADSLSNSIYGSFDNRFPLRGSLAPKYPNDDYVSGFAPKSGTLLSATEVDAIIRNAVTASASVRAEIRRPVGQFSRVSIAVADVNGTILGLYRMADAANFGIDVSAQKSRTAVAFNDTSQALCKLLRNAIGISSATALAVSTRTIGFLAQEWFPPGLETTGDRGPLWTGIENKLQADLGTQPFGNGITIFPGGIPLYKNGILVGGIGVSGDGVNQDDYIAVAGAAGYAPPMSARADNFSYKGVPLPWVKFPRNP